MVFILLLTFSTTVQGAYAYTNLSNEVPKQETKKFTIVENGKIQTIEMNENREIFVNGKNITTIIKKSEIPSYSIQDRFSIQNKSDNWQYAGEDEYRYDLGGLGFKALNKIGVLLKVADSISTIKAISGAYMVDGVFKTGVYIFDRRSIYYKNIHQSRPDMKSIHRLYFHVSFVGSYEKYLGSFTSYN
ncbi:hypothetical protein [Anaerophilus nitritogenes]|uniref:hypothetical protein n=1 Tax=Anaerophilus nitritogenes TaxID=2498136 RepID=UPI00101DA2D8|nr:hypothetical protein [Anaerophilus nitritogenes]